MLSVGRLRWLVPQCSPRHCARHVQLPRPAFPGTLTYKADIQGRHTRQTYKADIQGLVSLSKAPAAPAGPLLCSPRCVPVRSMHRLPPAAPCHPECSPATSPRPPHLPCIACPPQLCRHRVREGAPASRRDAARRSPARCCNRAGGACLLCVPCLSALTRESRCAIGGQALAGCLLPLGQACMAIYGLSVGINGVREGAELWEERELLRSSSALAHFALVQAALQVVRARVRIDPHRSACVHAWRACVTSAPRARTRVRHAAGACRRVGTRACARAWTHPTLAAAG